MPSLPLAELVRLLEGEPLEAFEIEGVERTGDAWYLGQSAISLVDASSRFGYWMELPDSGRFCLLDAGRGVLIDQPVVAVIYRQFDQSQYSETPSEYFAGWVPAGKKAQLEQWLRQRNRLTEKMLVMEHQELQDREQCPACGAKRGCRPTEGERIPAGTRYVLRGTLACERCGHEEPLEAELDYAVDPSAPGNPPLR